MRDAADVLPPTPPKSPDAREHVVFYLNGKRETVGGDEVRRPLAEWLRERRGLVGTKIVCNEGDCGACSVLVGRVGNADSTRIEYRPIDSCIAFLFQLDRTHVVTVEGLSERGCLSPVQQAMVDCHGSQCGFCTPGFVMAMQGMVESGEPIDDASLRYGLSGNLCRCTGYVQIIEAGRQVARQMADSGKSDGESAFASLTVRARYDESAILEDFVSLGESPVLAREDYETFIPRSILQACRYRTQHPDAVLVAGGTDYGVLRNHHRIGPTDVMFLGGIGGGRFCDGQESNECGFDEIRVNQETLVIGGGVDWTAIERAVEHLIPAYHQILTRFGSPQIRNAGTIGGNLASGSPIADSVPLHLVLDTELELASVAGVRRIALEDFYIDYRKTALAADELIIRVHTRLPAADEVLRLFKISKRRDMDISTVTFALLAKRSGDRIVDAKVAIGGVGPKVVRVARAEAFLRGRRWDEATLRQAGRLARESITPLTDVRGGADYRSLLAENLMAACYYDDEPAAGPGSVDGGDGDE
jgi:xanthine dehydrogenase small subunit